MNLNKIVWWVKEKWKNIYSSFDKITNYLTMFEYIKSAQKIWLLWHDYIDWDSLWSLLAMEKWIKNKFPEKEIIIYTNQKPWEVFDFLNLERLNFWEGLQLEKNIDLLIFFDCTDFTRLWKLYNNNKEKIEKTNSINIDHHVSNTKFWNVINIVHALASSTWEVVYDIISKLELKWKNISNYSKQSFDKDVAQNILMAILTDTWIFSNSNSWEYTLKISAELIKKWADKNFLIEKLFYNKTLAHLKIESIILDRIKIVEENNIKYAYSYFSFEDLTNIWLNAKDPSIWKWFIDKLKPISNVDFICLWRFWWEKTKVSFRSKKFDVNNLAKKLWWWWHKNASAAKIKDVKNQEHIEKKISEII